MVPKIRVFLIDHFDDADSIGTSFVERRFGHKTDAEVSNLSIHADHPLILRLHLTKAPLLIEATPDLDFHFIPLDAKVVLPIFHNNTLLAFFAFPHSVNGPFTSNDLALFTLISSHLGLVLNTLRSHAQLDTAFSKANKTASMLSLMNQYQHDTKACWASVISHLDQSLTSSDDLKRLAKLLNPEASVSDADHHSESGLPAKKQPGPALPSKNWEQEFLSLAELIRNQYQRASTLSNTMSNILAGRSYLNQQQLHINQVVSSAIRLFPMADISFDLQLQEFDALILADLQDLQIMLINLFKNSAEAFRLLDRPPAKKNITTIKTGFIHPFVSLQITDSAGGIPDHVLEAFHRNEPMSTKSSGSGVGLLTIKRIARQHSGKLSVKVSKGKSTTFSFLFPASELPEFSNDDPGSLISRFG